MKTRTRKLHYNIDKSINTKQSLYNSLYCLRPQSTQRILTKNQEEIRRYSKLTIHGTAVVNIGVA
jgi:hypothetical protein